VLEAEALPKNYSTQQAEIVALTRACELGKGTCITIHTDGAYAVNTVHVFAAQWRHRGMVTTAGKPITHAHLVLNVLKGSFITKESSHL
jgi:ribonuclease HI